MTDTATDTTTRTAALTFEGVDKRFGDVHVLDDVSTSIAPGEFVSVIGPSGCGKSTLLRLASGLDTANGGRVECHADEVGYVFQEATLMPWRSVRRNVDLMLELRGESKRKRRDRVDAALELVGLDDFADSLPHQLSGGMRMRVSLARSLVLEPELFLFDEPFGALDQITRMRLNLELLSLFESRRFAGLFITHSVDEAVFLSTRVLVMSARPGRLVAEVPIEFGYPRHQELRYTPEFGAISGHIADALESAS
ncbi:MAG: ABC transporter ATP-binding protein [Actinomycetota bacterium]|nr:ABC transporter ATP-binding protein [Actinomycetota bacterium]